VLHPLPERLGAEVDRLGAAVLRIVLAGQVADRLRSGMQMFRSAHGAPSALVAAGGVAANQAIRDVMARVAFEVDTTLVVPPAELCTDNGAMIAWAGAERLALGLTDGLDSPPHARWPLSEVTAVSGPSPVRSAGPVHQDTGT